MGIQSYQLTSNSTMLFHPSTLFPALLVLAGSASSLPTKRQSIHDFGTITAPTSGVAIAPGQTFNFSFTSVNYCESGYEPLSVYLTAAAPSDETFAVDGAYGGFAEGDYLYHFGDYLIPNFGLPPMETPVPSTLVMPDLSTLNYTGTSPYIVAIETYESCPGDIPYEYGMTSNPIIYSPAT